MSYSYGSQVGINIDVTIRDEIEKRVVQGMGLAEIMKELNPKNWEHSWNVSQDELYDKIADALSDYFVSSWPTTLSSPVASPVLSPRNQSSAPFYVSPSSPQKSAMSSSLLLGSPSGFGQTTQQPLLSQSPLMTSTTVPGIFTTSGQPITTVQSSPNLSPVEGGRRIEMRRILFPVASPVLSPMSGESPTSPGNVSPQYTYGTSIFSQPAGLLPSAMMSPGGFGN